MTGRPDTWMPLYIGDYIADTMHLSTIQHGAYLLLIMAYWRKGGPVPNDDEYLKRVVRYTGSVPWSQVRSVIDSFFVIDGDSLRHKRVDDELLKASQAYERLSAAGKRGSQIKQARLKQPQPHLSTNVDKAPKPKSKKVDVSQWEPATEDREYAKQRGLDADRVLLDIRQWATNADKKRLKTDPRAFWQGWCRREADKLPANKLRTNGATYNSPPIDAEESQMKARARAIAGGMKLASVSDHQARTMVQKGYLTDEQARKAGYAA